MQASNDDNRSGQSVKITFDRDRLALLMAILFQFRVERLSRNPECRGDILDMQINLFEQDLRDVLLSWIKEDEDKQDG